MITTTDEPTPTTSDGTTGAPNPSALDEKCEECDFPETVQLCYCIDDAPTPAEIVKSFFGCPDDTQFNNDARSQCETILGIVIESKSNFLCIDKVMCTVEGQQTPTEETCAFCGDSTVVIYYCNTDTNEQIFATAGCADNPGFESLMEAQCAEMLSKDVEDLTTANFHVTSQACPGSGSTGGETTTGETTAGDSTAGEDDSTTGDPILPCDSWTPSASISVVSGITYMDKSLLTALVQDPTPLLECDDVRLTPLPAGSYEVRHADSGELLYELGLRDGDIPLYLNGYPLENPGDTILAFGDLWFIEQESEYELVVLREGRPEALYYSLVP